MLETVLSQLQTLTTHDHLTGALNRNSLIERLDFELQRSLRTGHTFSFAIFSIDHLPEIMEQHGQEITKFILQIVSQEASIMLRSLDSFGRIAATEFAIVMPTTWLEQSLTAILRLKERLNKVDWNSIAPGVSISISTGLTSNAPGDSSEQMLERAHNALENARSKGNNNIVKVETDLISFNPPQASPNLQ